MTLEECYIQYVFLKTKIGENTIKKVSENYINIKCPSFNRGPYTNDIQIYKNKQYDYTIVLKFRNTYMEYIFFDYITGEIIKLSDYERVNTLTYYDINTNKTIEVWI